MGKAAAPCPRRRLAFPAHAAGRLARRAGGRAGAAEGPARIRAETAFPPDDQKRARLRVGRAVIDQLPHNLPHVVIHTDGGSSPNPGAGGWAAILTFGD